MVQISRALAFFTFVSTALAAAMDPDATSVKGVTTGNSAETANISVNSKFPGSKANGGRDANVETISVEDKALVNAVVEITAIIPGKTILLSARAKRSSDLLTRIGPTGLSFAKSQTDDYCKFKTFPILGTTDVSLVADNGLPITIDFGDPANPPALWLNPFYPVAAFSTVFTGYAGNYLVVRDPLRNNGGPWTVTGDNINGNALTTTLNPDPVANRVSIYYIGDY
ncbi:hypothetical protein C8F04DRAFT_1188815 [Mycena alexandri]|uniref:Uncharacterized protein n=1 Tax=Mycena alexandri TaxID=1745969 RepID=A0AAD6SHU0_9AGAR|nr:hypothetical protein C8F04DRAFT_1188815 [Mycena alexandri]